MIAGIKHETTIDSARLRSTWETMSAIGATEGGGISRVTLTDVDRLGRDQFTAWCVEAGYRVLVDDFGNITARREGRDAGALPVVIGSHLDSVPFGGNYDGVLGVLAALEVARTLDDRGLTTERPIVIASFTNEEGVRYEPAMMASGGLAGAFTREALYALRDVDGKTFGDELARIGYAGEERNRLQGLHAYFELHIEQSPYLERADVPVGIVTMIQGLRRTRVTFHGEANHAGTTPLEARHDALLAAARFALGARDIARQYPPGLTTTGRFTVHPNQTTVIPNQVEIVLDQRHPEDAELRAMLDAAEALATEVAEQEGTRVTFDPFYHAAPTPFAPELMERLERHAAALDVPTMRLYSGAGHDAIYMAKLAPSAMIFVRTRAGRSHCEDEFAPWEDCVAATEILFRSVCETAGVIQV